MYYTLNINKVWLISFAENILLTKDINKATKYDRIGDAMRAAININNLLGNSCCKVTSSFL